MVLVACLLLQLPEWSTQRSSGHQARLLLPPLTPTYPRQFIKGYWSSAQWHTEQSGAPNADGARSIGSLGLAPSNALRGIADGHLKWHDESRKQKLLRRLLLVLEKRIEESQRIRRMFPHLRRIRDGKVHASCPSAGTVRPTSAVPLTQHRHRSERSCIIFDGCGEKRWPAQERFRSPTTVASRAGSCGMRSTRRRCVLLPSSQRDARCKTRLSNTGVSLNATRVCCMKGVFCIKGACCVWHLRKNGCIAAKLKTNPVCRRQQKQACVHRAIAIGQLGIGGRCAQHVELHKFKNSLDAELQVVVTVSRALRFCFRFMA